MKKQPLTTKERQLRGSAGGHISWARTIDRAQRTAPGRAAAFARFEVEARAMLGPDATDEQVLESAKHLQRAHMQMLAYKSARARRQRA